MLRGRGLARRRLGEGNSSTGSWVILSAGLWVNSLAGLWVNSLAGLGVSMRRESVVFCGVRDIGTSEIMRS